MKGGVTVNGFMLALEGDVGGAVSTGGWESVLSALTSSISAATVGTILAAGVSACAGIVLLYFGARKGLRMFQSALSRGKIKL